MKVSFFISIVYSENKILTKLYFHQLEQEESGLSDEDIEFDEPEEDDEQEDELKEDEIPAAAPPVNMSTDPAKNNFSQTRLKLAVRSKDATSGTFFVYCMLNLPSGYTGQTEHQIQIIVNEKNRRQVFIKVPLDGVAHFHSELFYRGFGIDPSNQNFFVGYQNALDLDFPDQKMLEEMNDYYLIKLPCPCHTFVVDKNVRTFGHKGFKVLFFILQSMEVKKLSRPR